MKIKPTFIKYRSVHPCFQMLCFYCKMYLAHCILCIPKCWICPETHLAHESHEDAYEKLQSRTEGLSCLCFQAYISVNKSNMPLSWLAALVNPGVQSCFNQYKEESKKLHCLPWSHVFCEIFCLESQLVSSMQKSACLCRTHEYPKEQMVIFYFVVWTAVELIIGLNIKHWVFFWGGYSIALKTIYSFPAIGERKGGPIFTAVL